MRCQVWDTAGQERFRSMTSAFFGKAQGALVVFDVSDRDSFDNLNGWIEEIERVGTLVCLAVVEMAS